MAAAGGKTTAARAKTTSGGGQKTRAARGKTSASGGQGDAGRYQTPVVYQKAGEIE